MKTPTINFRSGFRFFLLTSVATCLIIGVSGGDFRLAAQVPVIKSIQARPPANIGISNKDMQNICSAAISTLFEQPTSTIKIDSVKQGVMHLSYNLPTDSSSQQYSCKLEGKKVLVAKEDGLWRADNSDEQVTFQLTTNEILITVAFSDGSQKLGRFPR